MLLGEKKYLTSESNIITNFTQIKWFDVSFEPDFATAQIA
jgi:hypothetical protein